MKKYIGYIISLLGLVGLVALSPVPAAYAALNVTCQSDNPDQCNLVKPKTPLKTSVWNTVRTALIILGGVAVVIIIIGGIRYALSQGDAGAVTAAKNTILYAVVGLVVAIMATAIVTLVGNYFA